MIVLEMVHEVGAVAFDLLVSGDGTENDFAETLRGKRSETNASNWTPILDQSQRSVRGVKDKPGDVFFWHSWKLV